MLTDGITDTPPYPQRRAIPPSPLLRKTIRLKEKPVRFSREPVFIIYNYLNESELNQGNFILRRLLSEILKSSDLLLL